MKIRHKVIVVLLVLFAVLGAAQFLVQRNIVLPSFAALERDAARKDMDRVAHTLDRELDLLGISVRDWGNWAETYGFMQDHNAAYITANLTDEALASLRINALAFIDLNGRFVWSAGRESASRHPLSIDLLTRGALPENHPWRTAVREGRPVAGLLQTNQGVMAAVLTPILNGYGQGPPRGMVLMGRLISDAEIQRMGDQAQVKLSQVPIPSLEQQNGAHADNLVERAGFTDVVRIFNDVDGRAILALRIAVPRVITARGQQAVTYSSSFLIGAGIIVLVLMIALLNQAVLIPLILVTQHAIAIGTKDDLTSRLNLKRADELGDLAREFDRMVDSLASARRQLADRSFDAGIAEHASGALHNLGNAMTPLAVKVTTLQDTLRAAPAADVDLVLRELKQATGTARQADFQELLQLTSQDLAQSISQAREDTDSIVHHTHAIQRLLAELSPRARATPLLETIQLPELVTDSAELVPPVLRDRLTIELDSSMHAVGPIRVFRITLQQVFQNLIVNAAEAVQGTAQAGVLRIAAEVIGAGAGARLHLTFSDNGSGIHADHVSRIFERGFSTKSSATNSGIGLHWCANAVNALGGELRAESAGPQDGAVLHVILPLERITTTPIIQTA